MTSPVKPYARIEDCSPADQFYNWLGIVVLWCTGMVGFCFAIAVLRIALTYVGIDIWE